MTEQESQFSTSTNNIKETVRELCDTLKQIAEAANEISGANFDKLNEAVKPLKAYEVGENASTNLYNYANRIKSTTSDLSKYSEKTTVDTTSISSMGDAIKPFNVNKDQAQSLQDFITQIKAVKRTLKSLGSMDDGVIENVSRLTDSISKLKVGKAISTNLQNLIAPLEQLSDALSKLSGANIDATTLNNIFTSLSNIKVNKDIGNNIKSLSDALKPLKEALSDFKGFDTTEMDRLTDFLAQANNLKDVATVLKKSAENVKAAREKVDIAAGAKPEVSTEQKQKKEETTYTSDEDAILKRTDAIRIYKKSIGELLVLEEKRKGLEKAGQELPSAEKKKLQELKEVISLTDKYIDLENREYIQAKATTQKQADDEQLRANGVANTVKEAENKANEMRRIYDQINAEINSPGTAMGDAWSRIETLDVSNI